MGIDDAERGRLAAQMHEDARQHRVLVHIGKIPGVKGVAVVHRISVNGCARFSFEGSIEFFVEIDKILSAFLSEW